MKRRVKQQWDIGRVVARDLERAACGINPPTFGDAVLSSIAIRTLRAQWTGDMENVYRVLVGPTIEVVGLGLDLDYDIEGIYEDISELPTWMQERLAVLSMMKVNPPQTKVEGVGMRVDESVYWVLRGE